jgi:hypothetical protein
MMMCCSKGVKACTLHNDSSLKVKEDFTLFPFISQMFFGCFKFSRRLLLQNLKEHIFVNVFSIRVDKIPLAIQKNIG